MAYAIEFTAQALKALRKMPRDTATSIRKKLDEVALDPFAPHPNATKLQNREGYRLRVGDWRVIYDVEKDRVVILVLKIAPRGEVYQ